MRLGDSSWEPEDDPGPAAAPVPTAVAVAVLALVMVVVTPAEALLAPDGRAMSGASKSMAVVSGDAPPALGLPVRLLSEPEPSPDRGLPSGPASTLDKDMMSPYILPLRMLSFRANTRFFASIQRTVRCTSVAALSRMLFFISLYRS